MNNIATKLSAHERSSVIHFLPKGSQMDYIRRVTQVSHTTHQKISKDGRKKPKQQPQTDMKTERSRFKEQTVFHFEHHQLWCRAASGMNSSSACVSMKDERLNSSRQCAHMQAVAYTRGT